jgi:DNA polymerase III alpha subunit (gram-positive type)
MLFCWCDTETTGFDHKSNDIVQLSCVITDQNKKVIDKFNANLKPKNFNLIDEGSLEVIGKTLEELAEYPEQKDSFKRFKNFLDKNTNNGEEKLILCGYNVNFDRCFLDRLFKINKSKLHKYFWFESIDVLSLVSILSIQGKLNTKNLKLTTVCEHFSIDLLDGKAHNSMYDIIATIKLFYKINDLISID